MQAVSFDTAKSIAYTSAGSVATQPTMRFFYQSVRELEKQFFRRKRNDRKNIFIK